MEAVRALGGGEVIRMMATNALLKLNLARSTLRNQEREMSSLRTHLYDLTTLELNNRIADLTRSIRNWTLGLIIVGIGSILVAILARFL